jgi:hypothetical protein
VLLLCTTMMNNTKSKREREKIETQIYVVR